MLLNVDADVLEVLYWNLNLRHKPKGSYGSGMALASPGKQRQYEHKTLSGAKYAERTLSAAGIHKVQATSFISYLLCILPFPFGMIIFRSCCIYETMAPVL